MEADHAREFSEALDQIGEGWYRQAIVAGQMGIPEALGLSFAEWADEYMPRMKLAVERRREVVAELAEEGMSTRQIGAVLGVGASTVRRDLDAPNGAAEPTDAVPEREPDVEAAPNGAPPSEPQPQPASEPESVAEADAPSEPEPEPLTLKVEPPESVITNEDVKDARAEAAAQTALTWLQKACEQLVRLREYEDRLAGSLQGMPLAEGRGYVDTMGEADAILRRLLDAAANRPPMEVVR